MLFSELFDGDGAKAWRSVIFVLREVLGAIGYNVNQIDAANDACELVVDIAGTDAGKVACKGPVLFLTVSVNLLLFLAEKFVVVMQKIYDEVVGGQNAAFAGARSTAIYENSVLNARNIITTFYATQQLKVMLGEISDGLEGDQEVRDDRRRLVEKKECKYTEESDLDSECTCVLTEEYGFQRGCNITSCEDRTRVCDGAFNYPYISKLLTGEFLICIILNHFLDEFLILSWLYSHLPHFHTASFYSWL